MEQAKDVKDGFWSSLRGQRHILVSENIDDCCLNDGIMIHFTEENNPSLVLHKVQDPNDL